MSKVLIIEDDSSVRENIKEALELKNYQMLIAENGLDALEVCKNELPDLIISDIMMPYMNGYEVLQAFQSNPKTSSIPFIFLSAKATNSDIRFGMNGGADDYITKPFKVKELLQAVELRLTKKKRFEDTINGMTESISRFIPHELRTPLVSIMGYTELMINEFDKLDKKEQLEMLNGIKHSGIRLHKTIEKFILYSELSLIANDSSLLLDKETDIVSSQFLRSCIDTIIKESGREDDTKICLSDAVIGMPAIHIKNIINELVSNAVKFSSAGSVIEINGTVDKSSYVLEVTDHGHGMTKEQVARISSFLPHERELPGQDGNGLGIPIVKKILKIYNGKLDFESVKGGYTTVIAGIPLGIIPS